MKTTQKSLVFAWHAVFLGVLFLGKDAMSLLIPDREVVTDMWITFLLLFIVYCRRPRVHGCERPKREDNPLKDAGE
jgi:hypothetical protein